jgi:hypothetical protein
MSYGENMSFDEYDAALKDKLLRLFRGCMTESFLEEGEQRVSDRYAAGNCLAGSGSWYVFIPASLATDFPRVVLKDEPSRKVYSFKGRRGKTQIDQRVTVIKTDDGWRISEFQHPKED